MRVAMFALMVSTMIGSTVTTSAAQVTGGPVIRGRAGETPRDDRDRRDDDRDRRVDGRDRRDGNWDWRRDDGRRDDERWRNGRIDSRRDRDWERNARKRERELAKRYDRCQRDLWRNSRFSRNDRWGRNDRWDRRDVVRERERIARVCEREVYGYRRW